MTEHSVFRIFTEGDDSSELLVSWWRALDQNRGQRASLRRAPGPSDIAFEPSFHSLLTRLRTLRYVLSGERAAALAAVVGLTAHVKSHVDGASIARQMATPGSPGASAPLSGLRFRRLLAVSDRDELYPLLIRLVRLLDGRVNLVSLANGAFWWNERTKREWAYDYYATSPSEL